MRAADSNDVNRQWKTQRADWQLSWNASEFPCSGKWHRYALADYAGDIGRADVVDANAIK